MDKLTENISTQQKQVSIIAKREDQKILQRDASLTKMKQQEFLHNNAPDWAWSIDSGNNLNVLDEPWPTEGGPNVADATQPNKSSYNTPNSVQLNRRKYETLVTALNLWFQNKSWERTPSGTVSTEHHDHEDAVKTVKNPPIFVLRNVENVLIAAITFWWSYHHELCTWHMLK